MRILVTGATGQLGRSMIDAVKGSTDDYFFADHDFLDITDCEAVELCLKVNDYDVVVNCAAYTDVERAESQESIADEINGNAVGYLAASAASTNTFLIHISTDYVYPGDASRPYREDSIPSPLSAYGRSKLKGEKAIEESGCKAIVIRTSWLYSPYGRNFVKTMMKLTAERDTLQVVTDQIGSPTSATDLAEAIVKIITERKFAGNEGTYNYSNEGVCSWFDFAKVIQHFCKNDRCIVNPCDTEQFPTKAVRPSYSVMDKSKFKETFGLSIPYWIDSLERCIETIERTK